MVDESRRRVDAAHEEFMDVARLLAEVAKAGYEPLLNKDLAWWTEANRMEPLRAHMEVKKVEYEMEWTRHIQELHDENIRESKRIADSIGHATKVIAWATVLLGIAALGQIGLLTYQIFFSSPN